jgi:hypothetical protein
MRRVLIALSLAALVLAVAPVSLAGLPLWSGDPVPGVAGLGCIGVTAGQASLLAATAGRVEVANAKLCVPECPLFEFHR